MKRRIKAIVFQTRILLRILSFNNRAKPSFLIVGAQKAGTTSLFKYLSKHPGFAAPLRKEIHYFDLNYDKGSKWFMSFFPLEKELKNTSQGKITGEASPQYMFHPFALDRIKKELPDVKLIVLLRNPVSRAYSHYQHQVRMKRENSSFEEAIDLEPGRLEGELEKMLADPGYQSYPLLMYSYLSRSLYADQVEKMLSLFEREKILFIQSEELYRNPEIEYYKVLAFLGLKIHKLEGMKKYNSFEYKGMNKGIKQRLEAYFKPYNEKLYKLIGQRFDW